MKNSDGRGRLQRLALPMAFASACLGLWAVQQRVAAREAMFKAQEQARSDVMAAEELLVAVEVSVGPDEWDRLFKQALSADQVKVRAKLEERQAWREKR